MPIKNRPLITEEGAVITGMDTREEEPLRRASRLLSVSVGLDWAEASTNVKSSILQTI